MPGPACGHPGWSCCRQSVKRDSGSLRLWVSVGILGRSEIGCWPLLWGRRWVTGVEGVLASDSEGHLVLGSGPTQIHNSLQLLVYHLVHWTAKHLSMVYVSVQDKVFAGVSQDKVVLGEFRLWRVECRLVSCQPALVADNGRCIDKRTTPVHVSVRVQRHTTVLVLSLDLTGLGSRCWQECGVKCEFESLEDLVLDVHSGR